MCFILATLSADHPPVMSTLIQSHTRHPHWLSPLMTVSMRRGPSLPVTYSSSTGVSAVAGDCSLSRPLHQNHHPLEWPHRSDRSTSTCTDRDCQCVDRRWFACTETDTNNGTTHCLEHLAFKGNGRRFTWTSAGSKTGFKNFDLSHPCRK